MYQHDLNLLKFIWDNRHFKPSSSQCLFNICIEPMRKGDWNRYTIWLLQQHDLINVSETVYHVIKEAGLKKDIRLWVDKDYFCRPHKVEITGLVNYMLFQFFDGIAQILLKAGLIDETEAVEESYTFEATNHFKRLL